MLVLIGVMAGGFGALYQASVEAMETQVEGQPAPAIKISWRAVFMHAAPIVGVVVFAGLIGTVYQRLAEPEFPRRRRSA